jgi:hypothetical protein
MASYNSRTGFIVGKIVMDDPNLDTLYFLSKLKCSVTNITHDTTFIEDGVEYCAINLGKQIQQIGLPRTPCDGFPRFNTYFFIIQMRQINGNYAEHLNRKYSFWISNFDKSNQIGQ